MAKTMPTILIFPIKLQDVWEHIQLETQIPECSTSNSNMSSGSTVKLSRISSHVVNYHLKHINIRCAFKHLSRIGGMLLNNNQDRGGVLLNTNQDEEASMTTKILIIILYSCLQFNNKNFVMVYYSSIYLKKIPLF